MQSSWNSWENSRVECYNIFLLLHQAQQNMHFTGTIMFWWDKWGLANLRQNLPRSQRTEPPQSRFGMVKLDLWATALFFSGSKLRKRPERSVRQWKLNASQWDIIIIEHLRHYTQNPRNLLGTVWDIFLLLMSDALIQCFTILCVKISRASWTRVSLFGAWLWPGGRGEVVVPP